MQNMNVFYTQLTVTTTGADSSRPQHSYLHCLARLRQLDRQQLSSLTTLLYWSGWSTAQPTPSSTNAQAG